MTSEHILGILAVFFSSLGVYFLFMSIYRAMASRAAGKGIKTRILLEASGDAPSLERCVRAAGLAGEQMLPGGVVYIIDRGMSAEARAAAELLDDGVYCRFIGSACETEIPE